MITILLFDFGQTLYKGVSNWNVINKYDLATGAYAGPAISNVVFTDFELGSDGYLYAGVSNWNLVNKYDLATGAYAGPAISNVVFTDFELSASAIPTPSAIILVVTGLALLACRASKRRFNVNNVSCYWM